MIYLLCCVGCLLTYLCYRRKVRLENEGETKGVAFAFVTTAFDVLIPFTIVTFAYAVLSFSLSDMGSDTTTLETLRNYERRIQSIQGYLKYLKPSSAVSFLILTGWFLLAMYLRTKFGAQGGERAEKGYARYETYNKWIKRVATVVTMLASFTFFGSQVDGLGGKLQAHIKTVQDNYNAFAEELNDTVQETVANEAYQQVYRSRPERYVRLWRLHQQTWTSYEEAGRKYGKTKASYAYEATAFDALESKLQQRVERIKQVLHDSEKRASDPPRKAQFSESKASHLSAQKVSRMRSRLASYSSSLAARAEPILKTPLGKKLVPGVLSVLVTHKNLPVFQSLAKEIPLLEPIFSVLEKTLTKQLELKTNDLVHQLAQRAVTEPNLNLE